MTQIFIVSFPYHLLSFYSPLPLLAFYFPQKRVTTQDWGHLCLSFFPHATFRFHRVLGILCRNRQSAVSPLYFRSYSLTLACLEWLFWCSIHLSPQFHLLSIPWVLHEVNSFSPLLTIAILTLPAVKSTSLACFPKTFTFWKDMKYFPNLFDRNNPVKVCRVCKCFAE